MKKIIGIMVITGIMLCLFQFVSYSYIECTYIVGNDRKGTVNNLDYDGQDVDGNILCVNEGIDCRKECVEKVGPPAPPDLLIDILGNGRAKVTGVMPAILVTAETISGNLTQEVSSFNRTIEEGYFEITLSDESNLPIGTKIFVSSFTTDSQGNFSTTGNIIYQ